jgi:hypothetical protein
MNLSFQEKSIWSALTIIIVAYEVCCCRLFGGWVAVEVFKSAMQVLHHRRGL